MEKFKVKLNSVCTVCRGNAFCCGIIVMPPLNFSTWKKEGVPNKDGVSWRFNRPITKYLNVSLIKLMEAGDISEYFPSGSTANTTFVIIDAGKGSRDKIFTWFWKIRMKLIYNHVNEVHSLNETSERGTLVEGSPISSKMSSESCKMLSSSKETGFLTYKLATISWPEKQNYVIRWKYLVIMLMSIITLPPVL